MNGNTRYITEGPVELFQGVDSWEIFDPDLGSSTSKGLSSQNSNSFTIIALSDGNLLEGDQSDQGDDTSDKIQKFLVKEQRWIEIKRPFRKFALFVDSFVNLLDGRVLILERDKDRNVYACDLYDPKTDTVSKTGSLHEARSSYQSVVLASGKVLVMGGWNDKDPATLLKSCEVYDPATGIWSKTGDLLEAQLELNDHHVSSALLMPDGRVLEIGDNNVDVRASDITLSFCEYYDPRNGVWSKARGELQKINLDGSSLELFLVKNGEVLGLSDLGCSLYDPSVGVWKSIDGPKIHVHGGSFIQLSDGRVCVLGGDTSDDRSTSVCQIYDPKTGEWSVIK